MDLTKLEELARLAGGCEWKTEVPREATGRLHGHHVWRLDGDAVARCFDNIGNMPEPVDGSDVADYIAAANPAVVLDLIALIRKQEAELLDERNMRMKMLLEANKIACQAQAVDLSVWRKAMKDILRVLRGVEQGADDQWKFISAVCENAEELLAAAPTEIPAQTGTVDSDLLEDAYSTMLWLYRRLPKAYQGVPHVNQVIKATARAIGSDPSAFLAERDVPAAQQGDVLPLLPKEDMTLHLLPGEPIQSRKRYTANQMTAYGIHCADAALAQRAGSAKPSEQAEAE